MEQYWWIIIAAVLIVVGLVSCTWATAPGLVAGAVAMYAIGRCL